MNDNDFRSIGTVLGMSLPGRAVLRLMSAFVTAWPQSIPAALWRQIVQASQAESAASRTRLAGIALAAAWLTAFVGASLEPLAVRPILPPIVWALAAAVPILLIAVAPAFVHAWPRSRTRRVLPFLQSR